MEACSICGGQEFYVEAGFYFCMECHTQQEDKREEYADVRIDPTTRIRKKRIKEKKTCEKTTEFTGWTSWEKYNFILLGLTNQLISLGASPDIKLTILQLWATYLGKIEVAFMSTRSNQLPRLGLHFKKRDSEIIYGSSSRGRKRKRGGSSSIVTSKSGGSSVISSATSEASTTRQRNRQKRAVIESEYLSMQSESDTDAMSGTNQSIYSIVSSASQSKKNHLTRRFNKLAREKRKKLNNKVKNLKDKKDKTKMLDKIQGKAQNLRDADHLSLSTLWGILYIALRLHDSEFHMSDLLRLQKEGHLSHYKLDDLFPPDVEEIDRKVPNNSEITHNLIATSSTKLIKFLNVTQIPSPNLNILIKRYCTELQLPSGIALYAERVLATTRPVFTVKNGKQFCQIPNYEGKAMAIILMVMKIIFGLDGVTEIQMSRVTNKINTITEDPDMRLFDFCEWQRYIECRKTVLMSEHYPTKFKYDSKSPTESSKLYLDYLKYIQPVTDDEKKDKSLSDVILAISKAMKNEVERLIENSPPLEEARRFDFSFTPLCSYLNELKQDHQKDIPPILQKDLTSTKIGYITDPDLYKEVASQCGIDLKIVDSSGNFVEKIVPTFDGAAGPLTTCPEIFNEPVSVVVTSTLDQDDSKVKKKKIDDGDYLTFFHRKNPGKIIIDEKKKKIYETICKNNLNIGKKKTVEKDLTQDYGFGIVLPNGNLYVPDDNSESDDSDGEIDGAVDGKKNILLSRFERENPCTRPGRSEKTEDSSNRSKTCNCVLCRDYPDETVESAQESVDINIENEDDNSSDSDPDISILSESLNPEKKQSKSQITYRPFKDYWLRRVADWKTLTKSQFSEIQSNLPMNYRWLLRECSKIIETDEKSLYHEVCRVESYFADVVCEDYSKCRAKKFFEATNYRSNLNRALIKTRWLN